MKRLLLSLIIAVSSMLSTVWAYDFSAVSPSGHTLYYKIISGTTNVEVVNPCSSSTSSGYYPEITGDVVIPATVTHNGITYNVVGLGHASRGMIYRATFEFCRNITSITIPNSVTSIGYDSFNSCSSLTSITIPNSVTHIGARAFYNCTNLREVISRAIFPPILSTDITNYPAIAKVPCGSLSYYTSTAANWYQYFIGFEEMCDSDTTPDNDTVYVTTYDTITIHDTTYVPIHDTTIVTQIDTIINNIHDTTYITQIDTVINTIHDTSYVNVYIPVHDTTYITQIDTVINTVHDTSYVNVYVPVHDTTYITQIDTVINTVHDTSYVNVYIPVHDTTYITQIDTVINTVHDTTIVVQIDTIINTVYDTVNNFIYDTTFVTDTLWLFDTIYIHDTIFITDSSTATIDALVYSRDNKIIVEGANGNSVMLFDVNGRILATRKDEYLRLEFEVPISGAYFVKIGNFRAKKVVVIK
ncbi:MAG: leucine-rich repeat domain-containing protein [Bacteroidales bacterium]|nr:leucine-rich repeat domain-containing protein [Bacteroidales bacterium]